MGHGRLQTKKSNWSRYNKILVQRHDFSIYLDKSLFGPPAYQGKGRPKRFKDELFIAILGLRYLFNLSRRSLEGFLRGVYRQLRINECPTYTTIFKRIHEIGIKKVLEYRDRLDTLKGMSDLVLAVDSSGLRVNKYSEWMRKKWGINSKTHRDFIKVHLAVEVSTHVLVAVIVTDEKVGDSKELIPLIEMCLSEGLKVKEVLADEAYDTKEIFGYLSKHNILATIRLRKGASSKSRTCLARGKEAWYIKVYGLDEWKKSRKYARRVAVEQVFGAYKISRFSFRSYPRFYNELRCALHPQRSFRSTLSVGITIHVVFSTLQGIDQRGFNVDWDLRSL
ncbi:MAG: IS5 family transposase [Promethearchaeota archaeon]